MPADLRLTSLPDSRTLSYTDLGEPHGSPVLLFHGTPACSASFDAVDEPARAAGVRVLAPDRPGIRLSSFQRKRRITDWSADVAALADELGAERFAVAGWSGGGPYALACAAALADRVDACAVIAGIAPPEMPGALEGLAESDQRLTRMALRSPPAARVTLRTMGFLASHSPARARAAFEQELAPVDVEAVRRYWPGKLTLFTEVFRHGARGVALDYALSGRRWGFELHEVGAPVTIWHGDLDRTVSLEHAQWLEAHLPHARLEIVAGAGHFSLADHAAEMLAALRPS